MHHCRTCCPLEVCFLDQAEPSGAADSQPFGSPMPMSPLTDAHSPGYAAMQQYGEDNEEQMPSPGSPADSTPSSHNMGTPSLPSAPTKQRSHGSVTSRSIQGGTPRSLIPVFNGFSAAAARANQLGGRFATLSPQATAIARLQRRLSGSADPQPAGGAKSTPAQPIKQATGMNQRKRARTPDGSTGASGPPSIHTASQRAEGRTLWFHSPADEAAPKQPRI